MLLQADTTHGVYAVDAPTTGSTYLPDALFFECLASLKQSEVIHTDACLSVVRRIIREYGIEEVTPC